MSEGVSRLPSRLFGGAKPDTTSKADHPVHGVVHDQVLRSEGMAQVVEAAKGPSSDNLKMQDVAMILAGAVILVFVIKRYG